jgi:hypothetical protein
MEVKVEEARKIIEDALDLHRQICEVREMLEAARGAAAWKSVYQSIEEALEHSAQVARAMSQINELNAKLEFLNNQMERLARRWRWETIGLPASGMIRYNGKLIGLRQDGGPAVIVVQEDKPVKTRKSGERSDGQES